MPEKQVPRTKHMDYYSKSSVVNLALVSLLLSGVLYLCIWPSSITNSVSPFQNYQCPSSNMTAMEIPKDELDTSLERASMGNKTVIIAVVNKAYVEGEKPTMLDLFLEGFWQGEDTRTLVDHLLLVAVDQTAFDRCNFLRLHCYKLVTEGVEFGGEKLYMTQDFIKMMWGRTLFLADVLKRGYNFIFTDTDIMWLRNPFDRLILDDGVDLQISCDKFYNDSWSKANLINTGFYFVRSNNKTIALFDSWYAMKDNTTGMKEQDVLLMMMHTGVLAQLGLRVRLLDTLYFSGFCQDSRDFNAVTTVHANCCRSIKAKVADLMAVLRDWRKFKGSSNHTMSFHWSLHIACYKSWRGFNFSGTLI